MTALGAEAAGSDEPTAFVAITVTSIVEPTSGAVSTYSVATAPSIGTQLAPEVVHRSHRRAYAAGEFVQDPTPAESVSPSWVVPEIDVE